MDFRTLLKKKKYAKFGADDEAPDWGDLKHVEEEEPVTLKKVEKVSVVICRTSFGSIPYIMSEQTLVILSLCTARTG